MSYIGSMLIGDLMNSAYKPEQSQDPNQLYQDPNWFQRLVSPAAQQANLANAQFANQPKIAQQQNTIRNAIGGTNYSQLPPGYMGGTPYAGMTPTQQYLATGGNPEYSNVLPNSSAAAKIQAGLPAADANASFNEAAARSAEAQNAATKATMLGLLGTPASEGFTEDSSNQHVQNVIGGQLARDPSQNYADALRLGNDITEQSRNVPASLALQYGRTQGEQAALPYENRTLLGQSAINSGLTDVGLGNLGTQQATLGNKLGAENIESRFIGGVNPMSPYSAVMNNGTVKVGQNPLSIMSAFGGGSAPIGLKSGIGIAQPSGMSVQGADTTKMAPHMGADSQGLEPMDGYPYHYHDSGGNIFFKQSDGSMLPVNDTATETMKADARKSVTAKADENAQSKNDVLKSMAPNNTDQAMLRSLIGRFNTQDGSYGNGHDPLSADEFNQMHFLSKKYNSPL